MKKTCWLLTSIALVLFPTFCSAAWDDGARVSVVVDGTIDAAGDLFVGTADNTAGRLAIGANNTVLQSDGTTAEWVTNLDVAGDVLVTGSDLSVGAAGVKITGDGDGALTFLGLGDGFDENLVVNFDDTENTIVITTGTGVTTVTWAAIGHTTTGIVKAGTVLTTPPTAQVIAGGNTVAADACGGMKPISAGGNVTTDTTNTFTAPAAANTGCCLDVVNIDDTDTITLDGNANFLVGGSNTTNVALTPGDAARVCSNGTTWYLVTSYLTP